ncbi:HAD-IA family hydrolase [Thalassospira sp.]|uniref:HAD-IA family hydrolase n=1 Tax=Thalassospira sp. TaxID=1912094 RepID=UPI00273766C0|nr:HAD-IA family hydrolase [Thalassospira sp.]MDP2697418.1 HAD-IA family hydrolase [Thalassospira sp.]
MMTGQSFTAFLFDMDGTILDSIAVSNRVWTHWANSHQLNAAEVTKAMHGVRAVETIRRFAPPGVDVDHEAAKVTQAEMDDLDGIVEIPGAKQFLTALPPERWAIVTSAPRQLALRRLGAVGLPIPEILICAEDVSKGKPAPDCFIAAAGRLGVDIADCLVWEDAEAGIKAAEAAGASVRIITATHSESLQSPHPVALNYENLAIRTDATGRLIVLETGR